MLALVKNMEEGSIFYLPDTDVKLRLMSSAYAEHDYWCDTSDVMSSRILELF